MRGVDCCKGLGLLALPFVLGGALLAVLGQAPESAVTLKVAKLDELMKTLAGLKGRVVVVDFWADT